MPTDTLYLVLFHVQDPSGAPIAGAIAQASSPNGQWQSMTNQCGDVIDPGTGLAGVMLSKGDYSVTFRARGYEDRTLPVHIETEGPPIRVGLERGVSPFPPAPTRDQVCALKVSLQGLTYQTAQYGAFPAWFYAMLTPADRASARATHRAAGDTHITIPISEAYKEPGTLWPEELKQGYDFTQNLEAFRDILTEAICDGFFIDVPLAGDGQGAGPGYNDPVGNTYGFQWLMDNLPRIIASLSGDGTPAKPDLTPFILFRPGWDGVF